MKRLKKTFRLKSIIKIFSAGSKTGNSISSADVPQASPSRDHAIEFCERFLAGSIRERVRFVN
jgi:hypothetical protein